MTRVVMSDPMSKETEEPKLFLFTVPIVGIGSDSDEAFEYALEVMSGAPEDAIRGEVTYEEVEDVEVLEIELDRIMAAVAKNICKMMPKAKA